MTKVRKTDVRPDADVSGHDRPTKCEKNFASYQKDSKDDEGKQSAPGFSFCVRSQGRAVAVQPLFLERLNDALPLPLSPTWTSP
jgi:hypothetical protein